MPVSYVDSLQQCMPWLSDLRKTDKKINHNFDLRYYRYHQGLADEKSSVRVMHLMEEVS